MKAKEANQISCKAQIISLIKNAAEKGQLHIAVTKDCVDVQYWKDQGYRLTVSPKNADFWIISWSKHADVDLMGGYY